MHSGRGNIQIRSIVDEVSDLAFVTMDLLDYSRQLLSKSGLARGQVFALTCCLVEIILWSL